jgi:hypothetical protein
MDEQEEKQVEEKRSLLIGDIQNRKGNINVLFKMRSTKSG